MCLTLPYFYVVLQGVQESVEKSFTGLEPLTLASCINTYSLCCLSAEQDLSIVICVSIVGKP